MKASYKLGLAVIFCYLVAWLDRMAIALTLPAMQKDLEMDAQTSGYIISAFFLGYALFQIPGGILSDKFGPRRVILTALSWWSVFTALTGAAFGVTSMLITRFFFGIGEGLFPASVWKVISGWFTKKNRATANAMVLSAIAIGPAITPFVLQPLIGAVGWRGTYFAIGLLGLVCVAVAWRYIHNTIYDGRAVSDEEKLQYEADSKSTVAHLEATGSQATFVDILKTPMVWVLFFIGVLGNIGMYGWLQWLPSYFKQVHKLDGMAYMFASAVPWIAGSVGCMLGGFISDTYFRGKRKWLIVLCQTLGGINLLAFVFMDVGNNLPLAMVFQGGAGFFAFMAVGAIWSLPVNLLPAQLMGTASGLINMGGQIGGVLSGIVIGTYIKLNGGDYQRMWDVIIIAGLVNGVLALVGIWEKRVPGAAAPAATASEVI